MAYSAQGGNQSSLMDMAAGKTAAETDAYMGETEGKHANLLKQLKANQFFLAKGLDYTPSEQEDKMMKSANSVQLINMDSAQFLESTYNLAAVDIIIGHVDRHIGNYMVTESGIKGIDNDTSFGLAKKLHDREWSDDVGELMSGLEERDKEGKVHRVKNEKQAILLLKSAFPKVPKEFRAKILAVTPDAVNGALKGLIRDDEVEACVARVKSLQEYMQNLSGEDVVDSFEDIDRVEYSKHTYVVMGSIFLNGNYYSQTKTKKLVTFDKDIEGLAGDSIVIDCLRKYMQREQSCTERMVKYSAAFLFKGIQSVFESDPAADLLTLLKSDDMSQLRKNALDQASEYCEHKDAEEKMKKEAAAEAARAKEKAHYQDMDRGVSFEHLVKNLADYKALQDIPSIKGLLNRFKEYESIMKGFSIPDATEPQEFINELALTNGKVMEEMQGMMSYLENQINELREAHQEGVAGACITALIRIHEHIDLVNKIQENYIYAARNEGEIPHGAKYTDLLKNVTIYTENEDTEKEELGQGQMNTVYSVNDPERDNRTRVLKEGSRYMDVNSESGNEVYERLRLESVAIDMDEGRGIPKKNVVMNTAHRDVAVSIIDNLFGLNAVVNTSMAYSASGKQSSLMDMAAGGNVNKVRPYFGKKEQGKTLLMKSILQSSAYISKGVDYEPTKEEGEAMQEEKKKNAVDIDSAKFLESTYNLAALDIIVNHVDRHGGNYMVTEEGIKGIDNDTAFGLSTHLQENIMQNMTDGEIFDSFREAGADGLQHTAKNPVQATLYLNQTFPKVPDAFRQKILRVTPDAVKGALKGLIANDEIQACVTRMEMLQKYLSNLPQERIVDSFDEIDEIDREQYYSAKASFGRDHYYANYYAETENDIIDLFDKEIPLLTGNKAVTPFRDYLLRKIDCPRRVAVFGAAYLFKSLQQIFDENPDTDLLAFLESDSGKRMAESAVAAATVYLQSENAGEGDVKTAVQTAQAVKEGQEAPPVAKEAAEVPASTEEATGQEAETAALPQWVDESSSFKNKKQFFEQLAKNVQSTQREIKVQKQKLETN